MLAQRVRGFRTNLAFRYMPRIAALAVWAASAKAMSKLRPMGPVKLLLDSTVHAHAIKRLRTSFHRTRRKDLVTYLNVDLPHAHHVLTARTKHLFDLTNPVENGAFLNLLQHHGYPTPLLDWSYSPFVAAFFAYRFRRTREPDDRNVRILCFDKGSWERDFRQIQTIAFARPHFSIMEALTIENLRAMPQQSLSSVTNLDDIESYLLARQEEMGIEYLRAIDLPFSERRKVMEELSLMGITAGSLFPGLDGACEELRGRYFHPFE